MRARGMRRPAKKIATAAPRTLAPLTPTQPPPQPQATSPIAPTAPASTIQAPTIQTSTVQTPTIQPPAPRSDAARSPADTHATPQLGGPYRSDGSLREDWLDRLSLNAFDEIAFFREYGIAVADATSFTQRLDAAYRCFRPAMTDGRSPLELDDMNQPRLQRFFQLLLPALGLDEMPFERLAPQFKAHLFQRWFLSLASPPSADGNGGPEAFPLKDLFLSATYARPALVRACGDGPDRPQPMRVDYLHANIAAQFRRENPELGAEVREWILAALLSIFEPTLLRLGHDLPPNFRYGTLEWTLLDMGLRMAGPQGQRYSHRELVGLAAAADVVANDGGPGLAGRVAGSILRMAHAQGMIDLRDGEADMVTMLETAIPLFQRALDELGQSASIAALLAAMPTRGSIAAAELRKRGLNPEKSYYLRRKQGYQRDLLASQAKAAPGLTFNAPHALVDFVMADCVRQLYQFGGLARRELATLERGLGGIIHAGLNTAFRSTFDAAFHAFSDHVLARLLNEKIGALDSSDVRFWQCGNGTVSLPKVRIVARIPSRPDLGATGVGRKVTSRIADYTASRGVLVALTLEDSGGAPETRHYWVLMQESQEPLAVERFDGDVMALLYDRRMLNAFFEPKNDGESLLTLDLQSHPRAEIVESDAALTVSQLVVRQLLAPHLPTLREQAFQMTGPEARLEEIAESLLNMLPFRTCAKSLRKEGSPYGAALYCMTDIIGLLPVVRAGSLALRSAMAVAAVQSGPQLKRLAQSLARSFAGRGLSHAAIRNILYVGRPSLLTVKAAARFFNPLDPLWSGFIWIRGYRAQLGAQLLQKLGKIPLFRNLVRDIERDMTLPCVFEKGFWRAAPGAAVTREKGSGLRQLRIGEKNYLLTEVGGQRDVLALSEGGLLYLADPRNGGILAPISQPRPGMRYNPRQPISQRAICRSKRSDTEDACANLIEPAGQFGSGYFRIASEKTFEGVQMRVRQLSSGKAYWQTKVNLNGLGFKSGTKAGDGPRNKYFAFDGKIWIAENGSLRETGMLCPYPERIEATVVRLDAAGTGLGHTGESTLQAGAGDYLRFDIKLPPIAGEGQSVYQTFIAPYGTYPGPKGKKMGMLDFPDASYKFEDNWISELRPGQKVLLKRVHANAPDSNLFEQYRLINLNVRSEPDAFQSGSLYQLRDAGSDMQQRFDKVFSGAEKMMADALRALKNPPRDFDRLMENLLPQRWSRRKRRNFLDRMENNLEDMIAAARIVKRNKYEVIGFGHATRSFTGTGALQFMLPYVRGEALSASMVGELKDFTLIRNALLNLDEKYFQTAPEEALMTLLVHELSHLCVPPIGSSDTMNALSTLPVYPHESVFDRGEVNIASLRAAWARPDSDPAMHASTIEIMVKLLSALMDPAERGTLDGIMAGGTTFRLRPDVPDAPEPACAGNCVVQR